MRNFFELSLEIEKCMKEISTVFGDFQKKSGLVCPTGCGKCCFKADISCSPYELLPLALQLLKENRAEEFLEKANRTYDNHCMFLNVTDKEMGHGYCSEYQFRPFVCRAFGISARHGKNDHVEYSMCKVFKDNFSESSVNHNEIPFIEIWRKKLGALDPHLMEKEVPLNQALVIILEKVLLWDSLREKK